MSGTARRALIGAGILAVAALAWLLPVRELLGDALAWIGAHRETAWAAFIGLYVVAAVAMVPGSILTLAAGFLFGLLQGTVLASIASVAGAAAAFLIGRFVARDWVADRISGWPRFALVDRAVGQRGFLIVTLTRLSPIFPFNLLNYAFGITAIRFPHYVLASWIGMLPATVLYVYLGTAAKNLSTVVGGGAAAGPPSWLLWTGLAATAGLTVLVTRIATRALRAELDREAAAAGSEGRA